MRNSTVHLTNKSRLYPLLNALAAAGPRLPTIRARLRALYHPDVRWRGSHPLNELSGIEALAETVWAPLLRSFPDLERRDLIVVGGSYRGRDYVACLGHYCGTFRNSWLTIPATGRPVYLRYGEIHRLDQGMIVQSTCLWDLLDLIRQAGFWPLAPSLGCEGLWPGPITNDGLVLYETDPAQSAASLAQTLAMHQTLADYNDERVASHPTAGLQGFVDYHQLPFRIAFPNRIGGGQWDSIKAQKKRLGGGHFIRIGDGPYSVTGGWPSVYAVHKGGNFLGLAPTGREISLRVMDFYLHHEGLIRENWVPLDIINFLQQIDVDVFDRMQSFFNRGG